METKLSKLKNLYRQGDFRGALRIAAKFPDLGKERDDILKAHESFHSPSFYKQLGYNIEELQAKGKAALEKRYKLSFSK